MWVAAGDAWTTIYAMSARNDRTRNPVRAKQNSAEEALF
jgi:hypothetical protein